MFSSLAFANAPEKPPKKWPCDQVYNPKLNLAAIWQGPSSRRGPKKLVER